MSDAPEPPLEELLWTAAAARLVLPPEVHVQCPPNLSYDEFPRLLEAGIDDWGGISPVTVDHVNPEAPWPEVERLRAATEAHGLRLAPRLPLYPEYVEQVERWCDRDAARAVRRQSDAGGLMREDGWAAGVETPSPPANGAGAVADTAVREALARVAAGAELGEHDATALLEARGPDLGRRARRRRRTTARAERRRRLLRRHAERQLHERLLLPLRLLRLLEGPPRREPARPRRTSSRPERSPAARARRGSAARPRSASRAASTRASPARPTSRSAAP